LDQTTPFPLTGLTPMENRAIEEQSRIAPPLDPTVEDILQAPFGRFVVQTRNFLTGAAGWQVGSYAEDLWSDNASDPLNLEKFKADVNWASDPISWGIDNNPEGITRLLEGVPQDEVPYILTASNWDDFQNRLRYVKSALPEAQEAAGAGLGTAVGFLGDMAGLVALSAAAEPLVFGAAGGLPIQTMAGRVAAASTGRYATQTSLAAAAAEGAQSIGLMNLAARGAALGMAETAVYEATRNAIDPVYDPEASNVIKDIVLWGGVAGAAGGALFGRSLVADNIEDAARMMRQTRQIDLPGGYTIRYNDSFEFASPAAADQMLFARGTGSFADEANRIGAELWDSWNIPGRRADFSIPGAINNARSAIKAAAFELHLAGMTLSPEVFAKVAQALVRTESTKMIAGAFNKRFWEEMAQEFPGVSLRPVNERAFIGTIDTTVRDLARREDMVDSVFDYFRRNEHLVEGAPRSLIFQVLQEIRERGGRVNRETVTEVIDELRKISQEPPRRTNARGAQRIDYNARRAQVIEVINNRVRDKSREIFISPSLVRNMTPSKATTLKMTRAAGAVGTDKEFNDIPKIKEWFERIPGWSRIGNRAAMLLESNNGGLRLAAFMAKNAARSLDTAQPQTFFEAGTMLMGRSLQTMLLTYRNGMIKFLLDRRGEPTNSLGMIARLKNLKDRAGRQDFHRRVAAQLESGAFDDASPFVNETAQAFKKLLNDIHGVAHSAGLKGFQGSAVANYFPWLWRFDRIRRLATTEAGKKDLVRLIRQSWGDKRTIIVDGVEQAFTGDLDEAATALAERLIRISKETENAPLTEMDQDLFDALRSLEGPLKTGEGSRTPFGRGRIMMDRQTAIQGTADHLGTGKTALSMTDLRNDDLPQVMKRYLTSVIGAVTEKRYLDAMTEQMQARGFKGPKVDGENIPLQFENVEQLKGFLKQVGEMSGSEEAAFDTLMGALRFAPAQGQMRYGIGDKATALAMSYGYMLTGGWFGFSAASEIARTMGTVGIKTTFTQIPVLREMVENWRNLGRPAQNMAAFADDHFAPSTGRLLRLFRDELNAPTEGISVPQRMLDSMTNVYADITGLAPVTSATQQLTAVSAIQHLYDVATKGARRFDSATIRALGLEPDEYEDLIRFVGTNAKTKPSTFKWLGNRVIDLDNTDALEFDKVKAFVQRMVDTRIQSVPTRGDFHDSLFTFWGRLLLQFQTFNLKGIDNFLIQNATRVGRGAGLRVTQEMMFTGVMAGILNYGRNYANWWSYNEAGDRKKAEEAAKLLTVGGIARGVLMGPSEFFLLTRAGDFIWTRTVDPDPLFSPYRYSGLKWYGFPAQASFDRAQSVLGDLWGSTAAAAMGLPAERRITQGTVHRGRLLLPGQNFPGFQQILNIAEQEVVDAYNLQKTQPRDRD